MANPWVKRCFGKAVFVLAALCCYLSFKTLILQSRIVNHEREPEFFPPTLNPTVLAHVLKVTRKSDEDIKALGDLGINANKSLPVDAVLKKTDEKCVKKWLGTPPSIINSGITDYEDITCSALLFGNATGDSIYDRAKGYMNKNKKKVLSATYYQENIQDIGCTQFKLTRGYHLNALDQEEEEFPIAYNILIHKDIEQVETLLRSIYRPQNTYCIHIDAKSKPEMIESIRAIASCFENVFLASRLERVVYAGFSRLQADINCMKDQVKKPIKWKYLFNVAGQEMPAKTNLEMVKILKIYNGSNDIEGIYGARVHRSRFENEWLEKDVDTNQAKMEKSGNKNPDPPYDIDIVRGSAYGVFSRAFIEWLLNDEKPKALLEWSRKTWSPDEHYWSTLHHRYTNPHLHPPGGYSGSPNDKPWLAVWVAWGGLSPCNGKWSRGTCVFGVKDLPSLVQRPEFMMNKFALDIEPLAQECIGRWIEWKADCPQYLDEDFYRKLSYVSKP